MLMTGAPKQAEEAINEKIYPFELRFENKCRVAGVGNYHLTSAPSS
jgi:hypothetical protein